MDVRALTCTLPALALGLVGCAPTLEYAQPEPLASVTWSAPGTGVATGVNARLPELLGSPELGRLTALALARNSDIRIADARVAQSSALLRQARQATLPEASVSVGGRSQRQLDAGFTGFEEVFASLDLSLELDLFGRLGAAKQSATARFQAAQLSREAVSLAVEAEVAAAFVQGAALQRQVEIIDQNIKRAEELERIIRIRFEEGAASRVDLGLQSVHLLNLRAERSRFVEAQDNTRSALALLVGEEAPLFHAPDTDIDQLAMPQLAPASPAQLLAARPDIRAAEAMIAAANGDVREARANFFPKIDLGISTSATQTIGGPLAKAVNIGSSLLLPIFGRGRLEGEFRYSSAVQVEAVESYRKAILGALSEVEDANSAMKHSGDRAALYRQIVDEARTTADVANLRYIEGEEDLQSLLDAQQFLADAEEAQALALQAQIAARIALYRAMGGLQGPVLAYGKLSDLE